MFFTATAAILLLPLCQAAQDLEQAAIGLDMDEADFEEFFHLEPITDPEEFEKRQKALKASEEEIKQVNKDFAEGKKSWFDHLNDFSNLPEDEFIKQKTGLIIEDEDATDDSSETYFARYKRNTAPESYNAVSEGLVSPIKYQQSCGSCAAFAAMSCVETCFKKATGVFGDYSEQQMLDCAYGQYGANGCDGAAPSAYLRWAGDNKVEFASETTYPYKNRVGTCPANIQPLNQGAKVTGSYYTRSGNEEMLKNLVYEHGAVLVAIHVDKGLQNYGGSVYSNCIPNSQINHGVVVVGYGRENGKDYWLFKNSWGTWWGDDGYGKLERGVNMCSIGGYMATTECERTGPAPTPCTDDSSWCNWYTRWCSNGWVKRNCKKSCNLC